MSNPRPCTMRSIHARSRARSRNAGALHDPHNRALIAANAATAGWRHGGDNGWWRHRNGGFGWVGPLFWPFAYYDIYDYTLWGYGYDPSFWGYGYDDIYAGMFAPYGYRDSRPAICRATPAETRAARGKRSSRRYRRPHGGPLAQMCGEDSRDIAGSAGRPVPAGDPARRRATRRARRSRQRVGEGGAGHQGRLPDRDRADGAGPARRHAKSHRGDGRPRSRPCSRRWRSSTACSPTSRRSASPRSARSSGAAATPARSTRAAAPRRRA